MLNIAFESSQFSDDELYDQYNIKRGYLYTTIDVLPYTFSLETVGGTIDSSYNSVVNPYNLNGNEYYYKSFYLIDDIEYDYVLNSSNNGYVLGESNLNTYTGKYVYVKINDGSYEFIGAISKMSDGKISYLANDSRTINNSDVTESNPVILPETFTFFSNTFRFSALTSGSKNCTM